MLASLVLGAGLPSVARADAPTNSLAKEAGMHFQRGVALFNEADYRAALVEFRRAYEIAPKTAVLYNIGQTQLQLQSYAAALTTLERYLAEAPASAPHRAEVEQTLQTLRTRVGKLAVTTNVPGAEVTIDDEAVGKTPLAEPVLVSVGRRKVIVSHAGHGTEIRTVDVAAGDTVKLAIALADPKAAATGGQERGPDWVRRGWITTGVLGAGALTAGVFAYLSSRDLKDARHQFPASADDIDRAASRVSRLSLAADVLGVAAVITGGITLKLSLSQSPRHEVHVAVAPSGIQLAGSFQ